VEPDNHSVAAICNSTTFDLVRSEQEQQHSFDASRIGGTIDARSNRNRTEIAASEREPRMNEDDEVNFNQNSSHDGRSNGYMQIEAHEVEIMSE